jgi:hypothetical protein
MSHDLDHGLQRLAAARLKGAVGARFAVRYRQLCAETLVDPMPMDGNRCDPVEALRHWVKQLLKRQAVVDDALRSGPESEEVKEIASTSFPSPKKLVSLEEAFHELKSFLTSVSLSEAVLQRGTRAALALPDFSSGKIASEAVADAFIDFVLVPGLRCKDATTPWWVSGVVGVAGTNTLSPSSQSLVPVVERIALNADPPTILVEYKLQSKRLGGSSSLGSGGSSSAAGGGGPLRHRTFALEHHNFKVTTPIAPLAKKLAVRGAFLGLTAQHFSLWLTKLQKLMGTAAKTSAPQGEDYYDSLDSADGIAGGGGGGSGSGSEGDSFVPPKKTPPQSSTAPPPPKDDVNKADLGLLYRDPKKALQNVDLQDADEFTVKEYKKKMDEHFTTKVLKPGDPGYVWDKRVAVKPSEKSAWDSDDD